MNKLKKLTAVGIISVSIGAGATLFTPYGTNAASNVILASVDWVNTKINPINTKLSSLENQIKSLETKVNQQQVEINNLKGGSNTNTPPSNQLPSVVYAAKGSVNIHRGALKSYAVVATKPSGSALTVIDSHKSGNDLWYRVSLSSTLKGWVYSGDVSTSKTSTSKQVVTTGNVNMRRGATTAYAVVETIPKGTSLKYIQSHKNSKGETWYNVESASGNRGWIISDHGEVK